MFKDIVHTLFAKFSSALLGFATIVLVSHALGAQGKGEQAIMVYNIYVLLLFFTLVGNSTLVYLYPRNRFKDIIVPSFLWIGVLSLALVMFFIVFDSMAPKYILVCIPVAVLAAISEINQFILLGQQRIKQANRLKMIYPLVSFAYIGILFVFNAFDSVWDCMAGISLAYVCSLFYGMYLLKEDYGRLGWLNKGELSGSFRMLFKLGATKQIGSIAQSLNYRLSFYLISFYCGDRLLGVYSNGASLGEAVMLFGTSLALVQYSVLSNRKDEKDSKALSWKMVKINTLFTFCALTVLCLLPSSFYVFLFGEGFEDVVTVIRLLAMGILLLSISSNFTQYFFSRGNFRITACASLIGLAITLLLGFCLIPRYGITGAAITALASYTVSFVIELYYFLKWK